MNFKQVNIKLAEQLNSLPELAKNWGWNLKKFSGVIVMIIENEVFGELSFNYTWSKYEKIMFFGKETDIVILIAGDEDGEFEKGQYEAFKRLQEEWFNILENLLEPILDYYKSKREELGYDEEFNEKYPEILTTDELMAHITLVGIKIPYADLYGGRSIGLSFDCTWDDENGLGLRLSNEQVVKVGYQDVAI